MSGPAPGCNGEAVLSLRLGPQPDKGKFEELGVFLADQACCETDSFPSFSSSGSALHSECVHVRGVCVCCKGEGEAALTPTWVGMASSVPPFCQVCGVTRRPFAELWFTPKAL